jgi:hypothetical protein
LFLGREYDLCPLGGIELESFAVGRIVIEKVPIRKVKMFKLFGNGKVLPFFLHPMNPTRKLFLIYRSRKSVNKAMAKAFIQQLAFSRRTETQATFQKRLNPNSTGCRKPKN